jgi:flagellar basal body rod protein FlgF
MRFSIRRLLLAIALLCVGLAWWLLPRAVRLQHTGRELDIAIDGKGYFQVENIWTGEQFYTRSASLIVNSYGNLAVGQPTEALRLTPAIPIQPDWIAVQFNRTGQVECRGPNNPIFTARGQIQLARFICPEGLREVAPGLFAETVESGLPIHCAPWTDGCGYVAQGFLEQPWAPKDFANRFDLVQWALVIALSWLVYQIAIIRRKLADLHVAGGDPGPR